MQGCSGLHAPASGTRQVSNKAANGACETKMFCLQVMYSEFLTLVHSGNVRTAGIDDQADKIYFSLNGHSSQQAEATETASTQPETSVAAADSTSGETASVLCCAVLCCAVQMICDLCR